MSNNLCIISRLLISNCRKTGSSYQQVDGLKAPSYMASHYDTASHRLGLHTLGISQVQNRYIYIYIDIYLVKSYLKGKEAIIRILIKCAFFKRGEKRKPKLSEQACRNILADIANPCRPQLHSSSHVMNLSYLIVLHTKWHHSKPYDLNRAIWECSGKGRLISSTERRFCRNTELEKYSAQTGNFDPLQKAPNTPYVLSTFVQMSLFLKAHPARIHLYIGIRLID